MKILKTDSKQLFWIYFMSASCYFLQGFAGLPSLSIFKYFKEVLMYSPEKLMCINSIIGLAWIPKIIWGYCIDQLLSRKTWIGLSLILDLITVLFLGLWSAPAVFLITLMFINSADSAIRDTGVDGTMCVEGKKFDITGKIQSIQWIFITIATIVTGILGGYLAEHYNYKTGFLLIIPFYLIMFIPLYFYKEEKVKRIKIKLIDTIKPYKEIFKHKSFLWTCLFLFLYKYSPSFGTPLAYMERDIFKWSFSWIGILGSISSIVSIIGAMIYWKICQKINIKKWLYYSVFLGACTTLSYLYYKPYTAVIYLILYSLIGMIIHLIIMDWMAKSSIKGLEATTFALLCGINNLSAGTASSLSGAYLYPKIGLQWLIIASALTSFACLPLIKKLNIGGNDEQNNIKNW
jgi:predicted MFS family arabinose efflux permease